MPGNQSIQSAKRTAQVLYAVAGSEEGLSLRRMAETLGVKANTLYRFIRSLEEEKFLSRREKPLRFVLGPALGELKRLDDARHLLSLSTRILTRMHARVPEAGLLFLQREGLEVYQRLFFSPGMPGRVQKRRQYVIYPFHAVLFLAYAGPEEKEAFYRRYPFETHLRPYWKSRRELEDFMRRSRKLGRCQPDYPGDSQFYIGVPIFSRSGELVAAVVGTLPRTEARSLRQLLVRVCVEAGQEITRKLEK